jgi:glycosyltransferase involved in cell wall biosynthesis
MLAIWAMLAMSKWHLISPEFPPMPGGVSEHSRVLVEAAASRGLDVHVWTAAGGRALPDAPGIDVHPSLGRFGAGDLARTGALLDRLPAPRRIVLQWVPHGYGRRGMNLPFARWLARRARAGDELDVMVHEPFADFIGPSLIQPARAVMQRSMTRAVVSSARRVWLSIPGWTPRLLPILPAGLTPRVLPVSGTIPVDRDTQDIAALRRRLLGGAKVLVGYFGAGGRYAETALRRVFHEIAAKRQDVRFLLVGRGTREVAARLRGQDGVRVTGLLPARELSQHLQACDLLIQPYVDGISGRRTTTISALEHGVPVVTTFGRLSEPFWRDTSAVETIAADAPELLAGAVERLLEPHRNAEARSAAVALYAARFDPRVVLEPLFAD